MWRDGIHLSVQSFLKYHIDAMVPADVNGQEWHLTSIYGHPVTKKRHETWQLIRALKKEEDQAWLVFGDFNEILCRQEKLGGRF